MRWYHCHYPPRPEHANPRVDKRDEGIGSYSSFIRANSVKNARILARRRNIGEIVDGRWGTTKSKTPYPLTSKMLLKSRLSKSQALDVIHSATFLSYLLMQSHSAPACDIVGDEGLLHQVIHSLCFGSPSRKDMAATLKYFEGRVPGYLP